MKWLTVIGLVFDIAGALVFVWGATSLERLARRLKGAGVDEFKRRPEEMVTGARYAALGFFLLVVGFGFQFWGSLVGR